MQAGVPAFPALAPVTPTTHPPAVWGPGIVWTPVVDTHYYLQVACVCGSDSDCCSLVANGLASSSSLAGSPACVTDSGDLTAFIPPPPPAPVFPNALPPLPCLPPRLLTVLRRLPAPTACPYCPLPPPLPRPAPPSTLPFAGW